MCTLGYAACGLAQQVSAKDVSALCCAKTCFVALRRMGEGGRLQGGWLAVAIDSWLSLQAR